MRFRFLAFGVIAGMLAACTSGSADGTSTPTPTPTPRHVPTSAVSSATPSAPRTGPQTTGPNVRPGEKPPVYPALAKKHTANGALAFGIYYFKAYDWGYATNDASLVRQISQPSCDGCREYVSGLRALKLRHETLHGGRVTLRSSSVSPNTYDVHAEYVVDLAVDEQPVVIHGRSGSRTAAPQVTNSHSLVFVSWIDRRWRVVEVTAK